MYSAPLAGVVETTAPSVVLVLSLVGFGLLSFAPDTRSVRKFFADKGVLVIASVVTLALAVGVGLWLFADEEMVKQWLEQYGLIALFFVLIVEGAMLLYFAPSEALVPFGVLAIADSTTDYETIAAIILVAVVGATIGQYGLFLLAKRGGREYLLDKAWFRVDEDTLDRFDGWFQKWGRAVVPLSNAFLFTRGMLTVPAGLAEMRDREFVVLSALGTLLFQTGLTVITFYTVELGFLDFL